ncbi:MAG TPA: MmcQ/YjbR family DNA-binding protein [Candidatus Acidoferrum sp.]|nr:MmcQ/YjbR family DNA-binding protein [Candidatus Acidoferrum sp.]
MTPNEFRKLALSFPETEERAHMNHPDFRVAGKIFATLGYPDTERGMVKVTPVEQDMLVSAEPAVFSPEAGAWGRKGCTRVNLKAAKTATLRRALAAAWQLAAPESASRQLPTEAAAASGEAQKTRATHAPRKKSSRSAKLKGGRPKRS